MKKKSIAITVTSVSAFLTMILWMSLTKRPFDPSEKFFFLCPLFAVLMLIFIQLLSNIYITIGMILLFGGISLIFCYLPNGIKFANGFFIAPGLLILLTIFLSTIWFFAFTAGRVLLLNRKPSGEIVMAELISFDKTGASMVISGEFPLYEITTLFRWVENSQSIESSSTDYLTQTEICDLQIGNTYKVIKNKYNKVKIYKG